MAIGACRALDVSAPLHAALLKTVLDIQKWPDNSQYSPLDPDYGARHPDMAPRHPVKGTKAP